MRSRPVAIIAGAAAGYLFTVMLAFVLFTCRGVLTERGWYAVDEVLAGFDALGKVMAGDRIVAIDGTPLHVPSTPSLVEAVNARGGAPVTLDVVRDGANLQVVVQPKLDRRSGGNVWVLG